MPTYQYRCTSCGRDLEVVQKFTDPALTECPTCQGELRKVFNAVGVVFKGSGFYRTDSRSDPKGGSEKKSSTEKSSSDTSSTSSTDSSSGSSSGEKSSGSGSTGTSKAAAGTSSN